ncbi:MAG TPA: DUF5916 domain-containing protein [Gemmatimonadales bacterium]|nr:DUF5916 domain-containing protein [Gemmatimonadales bacterium]
MLELPALAVLLLSPQSQNATRAIDSTSVAPPPRMAARATRAAQPPVIDGRANDATWQVPPTITDFQEWSPTEGKPPRFPTEATIAYDRSNLYILIRCFDPHPDSIIRLIGRRDEFPQSDRVILLIDSYHDRRTGFEFGVTAAGGRYDAAIYDDNNEDSAWDGVWDVATSIDSAGWTAEFRIPLSQLRYGSERQHTFGLAIDRDVYRYNERLAWPLFRQSAAGMVSQFAELTGLDDLEAPRRLEAAPYVVTKNVSRVEAAGFGREQEVSLGADLKYRVASNLTLDATVNPDFGQVEADPGVLNLTAYETFFPEKRPFFVSGRGLFDVSINCNNVNCNSERLFYTRRIGRSSATILGAAKLTGRLANGLRIGVLDAVTRRTTAAGGETLEPAANYGVVRLDQDFDAGEGTVGVIATAVNHGLDVWSRPSVPASSYAGAVGFRQRLFKQTYQISALLSGSRVSGSAPVIAGIQQSSVHYYQRPDAGLPYDTTRTVLAGDAEELKFAKVAGRHTQFETSWQRRSPGFEINDLGYLQRAGAHNWSTWAGYFDRNVRRLYQSFQWNWNWWQIWTTEGLPLERAANTNLHVNLRNNWGIHFGGTWGQLGATYDDRAARSGPAMRQDPYLAPWLFINGDDRQQMVPSLSVNVFRGGDGHGRSLSVSPGVSVKLSTRLLATASLDWSKNDNGYQWYGNVTDTLGETHFGFARLRQTTEAVTTRVNYTISPVMTLQVYAQPFVSKGTFSDLRELSATPRAARYDDRFQPYFDAGVAAAPGGFRYMQFRSSVVFRWEYKPNSILFVVWTQGRQGLADQEGTAGFTGDLNELFDLWPDNTFLLKLSYWINR